MLPTPSRLKNDKDIKTLFAKGKSVFDAHIGMKYRLTSLPESRVTVVVGTKVSKSAVERNRIKRRVRAVLEKLSPHFKPGFDAVFLPKLIIGRATFEVVSKQTEGLLRKAKLLK